MNRHLRPFGLKLGPLQAGAVYFPLHFIAVGVGFTLLNAPDGVGVFWPATGTLFAFLLLYPARYWLALLALGFLAEILANEAFAPAGIPYTASGLLFFIKFASALAGVWLMHISIRGPISFARLNHVLGFAAAAAVSTLACALLAVGFRDGQSLTSPEYWATAQAWWIGDFLGALIITPLILTIGFHGISVTTPMRGGRAATYSAFAVLLLLLGAVFLRPSAPAASLLDVPYIVYPVLVWIAMLGGPRRTAVAAGITVAVAALATTRGFGPFADTYQLQTFLALCVLPVLLLQAVMAERDEAIEKARSSDERYRAFVANSSEAIFRTELAEPMPITLSQDEQIAWVERPGRERRLYYAEFLRLKGWMLSQMGDLEGAERNYLASLAWAREQQAKSWELRTSYSLGRLWQSRDKCREARDLVAPVYQWFTEGFDTKDLRDAKALLDELGRGAA